MTDTVAPSVSSVLGQLTLEEKVGLLVHPMAIIFPGADFDAPSIVGPSIRELVQERHVRYMCLGAPTTPEQTAEIAGRVQELASGSPSGLPVVFSTDPRHSFLDVGGAAHSASGVSQWPEALGLGAIGDPELVRRYAEIVRDDYLAMGIRMALHPQVDLTTEPRWPRQAQSFGSDPALTSRLLTAYLAGLQGTDPGSYAVATTTKHFPGGGPQLRGDDPHFPYGREQVYPGGRFDDHLAPFRAAIEAGAAAIMPYYGMPVGLQLDGTAVEEVGFAFNRQIITGLLREKLGYDGVVLSDFGLVEDQEIFGKPLPARAWGVEHLSPADRVLRLFDAGIDQLGGVFCTDTVLDLVREGRLSEERIDQSARRVLALHEKLGAWKVPSLPAAPTESAPRDHILLGAATQARAVTVLSNDEVDGHPLLPLSRNARVHLVGISSDALPEHLTASIAEDADLAIMRVRAPFERRDDYALEGDMEHGSLEFDDALIAQIADLARLVPVVLSVTLSRPAILTPLLEHTAAIVGEFGATDAALLEALTGSISPDGRLPFDLPRSSRAVEASSPDVAGDIDPLFRRGWGLRLIRR
ncbi:glycoside hydrolase family 3 C-terminal domain-containing protein [Salinibacterium sp. SYSU T00001]|uniref:glycoside hydrolase family 3 protein n=1 Tax=Homoserinimonas sedimenticola TaxID=2986805 RepID=UPI0022355B38|nr:glycoside hydrolase family 3 N-terminal domain-containing protein [Salinibacterium sedimenticola]MCW4386115.1 glycoside hydrolase family 3 C-terminal domain-containing protein [Salinibacterium sedimenticola]